MNDSMTSSGIAQGSPVVKPLTKESSKKNLSTLVISIVVVLAGVGVGWLLSGMGTKDGTGKMTVTENGKTVSSDKKAGVMDENMFPTTAEGTLEEGGIKGEGTHHLTRPGGDSQTAYLVSTTLDLGPFVGKKVKIWGKTVSGQNTGWLLDVGGIQVVE